MRKLLKHWQRLPAKIRACCNLLGIGLCLLLIYIFLGAPPFSVGDAFRRAERANLVGPSDILAQVETAGTPYRHLVLAETDDAVTVFTFRWWNADASDLVYKEKTGDLTIAAAPDRTYYPNAQQAAVPVVLFDDVPEAVRAEVDITLAAAYQGEACQKTYNLTARRDHAGCFLFTIEASGAATLDAEGQLLLTLQQVTGNSMAGTVDITIPAAVRLYDESDDLIREETVLIRSSAAKAHAEQAAAE